MGHKLTKLPCMYELDEIIPYILGNECILFIGAGLSKIAGCYDWDSVRTALLNHPDIKEEIDLADVEKGKLSNKELIEFCYQRLTENGRENDFWGIARLAVTRNPKKFQDRYLPLVEKIREINPFPNIVTTNIDNCLEETGIVKLNRVFYERRDFDTKNLDNPSVFHIHGYIERFKDSLLPQRKYLERYSKGWFVLFLKKIFSDYSVLFVGSSLRDKEIMDIIFQTKNRKHLALVPDEDGFSPSENAVYLDLYNIKIVNYGSRDKFPTLLTDWINRNFAKKTKLKKGSERNAE